MRKENRQKWAGSIRQPDADGVYLDITEISFRLFRKWFRLWKNTAIIWYRFWFHELLIKNYTNDWVIVHLI